MFISIEEWIFGEIVVILRCKVGRKEKSLEPSSSVLKMIRKVTM